MTAILGLIPSWAWRWIAIALVAVAFGGFCYIKGNEHGTAKLIKYQSDQAVATVKLTAAREVVRTVIETKYLPRIQKIYVQGNEIIKEVPTYVTKTDDSGCAVNAGFVRSFNSAWAGTPAGPAAESDRAASGVPLSTVAAEGAFNATVCLAYKTQRDGLIEFYQKLQQTK